MRFVVGSGESAHAAFTQVVEYWNTNPIDRAKNILTQNFGEGYRTIHT